MQPVVFSRLTIVLLLTTLCGCTFNRVVVVAPNVQANNNSVGQNCFSPDDSKSHYLTPQMVVSAPIIAPPEAKAAHVNAGCAAVKFQIGADGKATNITVLREYPANDGFGAAVADTVRRSTYVAPSAADSWYFINNASSFAN